MYARSQQAALPTPRDEIVQRFPDLREPASRIVPLKGIEVLLWKIEHRFGQRPKLDKLRDDGRDRRREFAGQRANRGAGSFLARSINQVGDRISLGKVEPALEERPAGELAGLGKTCPPVQAGAQQGLHDHGTAVSLQLQNGLAGKGVW